MKDSTNDIANVNSDVYEIPSKKTISSGEDFLLTYPRDALFWKAFSKFTIFATGFASKVFVNLFHECEIYNLSEFQETLQRAEKEKRGLITVMNHVSFLDDPLVWGATLPLSTLARPESMRWTLAAKDICFRNPAESLFFSLGQVLSVERFGRGPDQPALDGAINLLSRGKWVHLYPEGFVHQPYEPFTGTLRYFHWGVSRLILESGPRPPIVLPLYSKGLQTVFPEDKEKRILGYDSTEPIVYAFGSPLDDNIINEYRRRYQELVAESKGELTPAIKSLRSEVAGYVRQSVIDTKKHFAEILEADTDPRLGDHSFWKTQTLIKLKGKSVEEKIRKGRGE